MVKRACIRVLMVLGSIGAMPSHAEVPPPGVTHAQSGSPSSGAPCVARGLPTVLAKQQFGDSIQDGVGYGGVGVGVPVSELVRRWGVGNCTVSIPEPTYTYLATIGGGFRDRELIVVKIKQGLVFTLFFTLVPHGPVFPSLTTSLGIKLLSTLAAVRQAYGAPDEMTARTAIYTGRGIGFFGNFDEDQPTVFGILVFPPDTAPAAFDIDIR